MAKMSVARVILIVFLTVVIVGSLISVYSDLTDSNVKIIDQPKIQGKALVGIYVDNSNTLNTGATPNE